MKETYDWRDKAPAETTVVIKRHLMQAILCPNGALGTSRSLRPHDIAHPSANEVVVENHAPVRFDTPARLQWLREDWRGRCDRSCCGGERDRLPGRVDH